MYEPGSAEEIQIGELTFYIRPIPPFPAIYLLGDLQKLIGPAFGKMMASLATSPEAVVLFGRKVDLKMLTQAFEALAEHVDGVKLQAAIKRILDPNYVAVLLDGKTVRLDENTQNRVFTKNMMGMFEVVGAVLQVTYGDFFTVMNTQSGSPPAEMTEE